MIRQSKQNRMLVPLFAICLILKTSFMLAETKKIRGNYFFLLGAHKIFSRIVDTVAHFENEVDEDNNQRVIIIKIVIFTYIFIILVRENVDNDR